MTEQEKAARRIIDRLTREWKMAHVAGENENRVLSVDFANECAEEAEILYELIDFVGRRFAGGKK